MTSQHPPARAVQRVIDRDLLSEWGVPFALPAASLPGPGVPDPEPGKAVALHRWTASVPPDPAAPSLHGLVFRAPDDGHAWRVSYVKSRPLRPAVDPWQDAVFVTATMVEPVFGVVEWKAVPVPPLPGEGSPDPAPSQAKPEPVPPAARWTDWRGQEYGVGDTILYPCGQGSSSAYTREGVILGMFHVARDEHYRWKPVTEEEAAGLDRWSKQARLIVQVTGDQTGLRDEQRGKAVTLLKREHVVLIARAS
jgi:hypothetical protein